MWGNDQGVCKRRVDGGHGAGSLHRHELTANLLVFDSRRDGWSNKGVPSAYVLAKQLERPSVAQASTDPSLDGPLDFAAGLAGLDCFSAVVLFLSLRERDFDFCLPPLIEIDPERDQRQPLLLCLPDEFVDLLPMQEKLSGSKRLMVHDVAMRIGTDVTVMEVDLFVMNGGITVLQVHSPLTQGFDFRTP